MTTDLKIMGQIYLSLNDVQLSFIRAQGAGGQNVNKVSSAVHLRFPIQASSLPQRYKEHLLSYKDHHISSEGIVIIKAQSFRTQEKNREDALSRLVALIQKAIIVRKKRKATKPTKASKQRRLDGKSKNSKQKALRKGLKDF